MARTNAEEWSKRVERWKDSGLTAKEFEAETGIKASTLSYWRWRLGAAKRKVGGPDASSGRKRRSRSRSTTLEATGGREASLVELAVATVANSGSPAVLELVLGEGLSVRIPKDFDEATLTRVVRAVGAAR